MTENTVIEGLLIAIHQYVIYLFNIFYYVIKRTLPRPSVTHPTNTTMTTTTRTVLTEEQPIRIYLNMFMSKTSQSNNHGDMFDLLKRLSIPPLLHVTRGTTTVLQLETANLELYCKSLPYIQDVGATPGCKSVTFYRASGIVVMLSGLNEEFLDFCNQMKAYVASDKLQSVPLLILLNDCENMVHHRHATAEECEMNKEILKNAMQERVKLPQKHWRVETVCTQCGFNIYQAFDWMCHIIHENSCSESAPVVKRFTFQ